MAPATEIKRPQGSYFMWFNSARDQICKDLGTKNLGPVGKKAGETWKAMSPADKAPWESKAAKAKEEFEQFKGTEEGQKALAEKKAEKMEAKGGKLEKKAKKAAKAVEKDDKLKKPASAYFIFMNEQRETIQKQLGTKDFGPVTKKACEIWKAQSESERKPWDEKAKAQKDAYDAYVASPEGAAALKAYKDQVNDVKASFKGKEPEKPEKAEKPEKKAKAADSETPEKKRKAAAVAGASTVKKAPKVAGKKAAQTNVAEIEPALLKEAEGLGFASALKNLIARKEITDAGKSQMEMLSALKKTNGLVNPAKHQLLGA